MVAGAALMVGYRSRLAAILSFILIAGFQERLPPLFDGSDSVLRLVLFWNCFTRSGNVWSVDALRAAAAGTPLSEKGPAFPVRVLQSQPGWVYFCSVFFKGGGEFWQNGTVIHYVMHLNTVFTHPWAAPLGDSRIISYIGTYGTLVLEATFLWAVNFPIFHRPLKALALMGGVALHAGIGFTMRIGHFSYLMPITYLPLLERDWALWLGYTVGNLFPPKWWDAFKTQALRLPGPT